VTIEIHAMRTRLAAQKVIEDLMDQRVVPRRSRFARLLGSSPLDQSSVAWYHGAIDDIAVGEALAKLPPDWTVFHSLPIGTLRAEIGHLVVGPGGVFTITVKNPRGKSIWLHKRLLLESGHRVPYLHDAEAAAEGATRVLRRRMPRLTAVRSVIALVEPSELVIREKPEVVTVVDSRQLNDWLLDRTPTLSPRERMEIVLLVDDPATWGARTQVDQGRVRARFAELDTDVRASRRRRMAWMFWIAFTALAAVGVETVIAVDVVSAMLAGSAFP